ncbi:MAG: endolytic transglycosylase MltG [Patescibacteria group bacterium]
MSRYISRTSLKLVIVAALAVLLLFYYFGIRAPSNFPVDSIAEINRGESIGQVANKLHAMHIIRSPFLFKIVASLASPVRGVVAGEYLFTEPTNLFGVIVKTTDIIFGISGVRVTVIEGMNNKQIAQMLEKKFGTFNKQAFLKKAADLEGYLFPDTYIFAKGVTEDEILHAMSTNFTTKTAELRLAAEMSNRTWEETVIMASILEREARTPETRKTISGILWKRIDNNVPLQVDAVFYYLFSKPTSELTLKDLLIDSPYNVYKYKGLPVGPIANPGLAAIRDAIHPTASKYWFFLSDHNGNMHYAATYESHLANKRRYLD